MRLTNSTSMLAAKHHFFGCFQRAFAAALAIAFRRAAVRRLARARPPSAPRAAAAFLTALVRRLAFGIDRSMRKGSSASAGVSVRPGMRTLDRDSEAPLLPRGASSPAER